VIEVVAYRQQLADAITELVTLEGAVAEACERELGEGVRVYEWRPSKMPELPAIWNWIDTGTYEIVDTARADDQLVVSSTIGVKPSDLAETMGLLMQLTDVYRSVVDPALADNPPLNGTVRYAKRMITRSATETFNDVPVMCMVMLVRLDLAAHIH
jgi:hypothetical protein